MLQEMELTDEAPCLPFPCMARYKCVTAITVLNCQDLHPPPGHEKGSFDPFINIKCEGEKVTSAWFSDTQSPGFNFAAVFYRKKPEIPITVEVWKHNRLLDNFVAEARCELEGSEKGQFHTLRLYGKKKGKDDMEQKPGIIEVFIRTSTDLTLL
ncbi:hypothetical protein ACOMHN_014838 [Nucella lapillus]